jgi:hypothetical protein
LFAVLIDSLSWTRRSSRNQTTETRRRAAAEEGSVGLWGIKESGDLRGCFDFTS